MHKIELEIQNLDLRESQRALEEARDRYAELYDFAPVGYITLDGKGVIRKLNLTASAMFGQARGRLLNRPISAFFETGSSFAIFDHLRDAAASSERVIGEFRLRLQDGRIRELRLDSLVRPGPDGEKNCLTTLIDVSASKQFERELRDKHAELESIVSAAPVGVALVKGRVFKWVTPRLLAMLGYEELELLGQSSRLLYVDDEEFERVGRKKYAKIRTDGVEEIETQLVCKDGRLLDVMLRSAALDPDNPDAGSIFTVLDISERKRIERVLKKTDRRKDEFLATLAHELRNPLAPIRNSVAILKSLSSPDQSFKKAIGMIDTQSLHLVRLIDDLMDASRITHGKLRIRKETIELGEVVQQAADVARRAFDAAGQRVTVTLPSEPIYLDADPIRLAQVFQNLLNNAGKYTGKGGRIRLAVERRDSSVVLKVSDTGIGIPAEYLPNLFDMFSQGSPPAAQMQAGLGIGLSLARSLVEMHGGHIEAGSEGPGKGSEFSVHLPIHSDSAANPIRDANRDGEPIVSRSRRILVVDDDPIVAMSHELVLQKFGMEVETVHDGLEAIAAVERLRPEVVLLDIGLPALDGYSVCRRIREQPWGHDIVVVALTGWGQDEDRREAADAGFDAHFVKPVDPDVLLRLITER